MPSPAVEEAEVAGDIWEARPRRDPQATPPAPTTSGRPYMTSRASDSMAAKMEPCKWGLLD